SARSARDEPACPAASAGRNERPRRTASHRPPQPLRRRARACRAASFACRISAGGCPGVFGDADTWAVLRRGHRVGRLPARWPLPFPDDDFLFEFEAEGAMHLLAHVGNQPQHIRGAGLAVIDAEIGVALGSPGVTYPVAL